MFLYVVAAEFLLISASK